MNFEDSKSAAEAAAESAAESAKKAIAAAEVAAYMAMKDYNNEAPRPYVYNDRLYNSGVNFQSTDPAKHAQNMTHRSTTEEKMHRSQSLPRSDQVNSEDTLPTQEMLYGGKDYRRHSYHPNTLPTQEVYGGKGYRRHSYHPTSSAHSDIKFDESDCDEEIEAEEPPVTFLPPNRLPPPVPSSSVVKKDGSIRVHPKLPDYDELAARFDALKLKKSQS